jgi:putative addiction module killer protein
MVLYVLPFGGKVELAEYFDASGRSPFHEWLDRLHAPAAAKVNNALERLERGNFSNVKSVGAGVFEYRIAFGPGYRVYFGKDGERWVILLAGGTKSRQPEDIARAKERWAEYKPRPARR